MTKPFELYSEKHGPVVCVMRDPWRANEYDLQLPMLVTADGTLWEYRGGTWRAKAWSVVESLNGKQQEFETQIANAQAD
jgi:hypothetical protein